MLTVPKIIVGSVCAAGIGIVAYTVYKKLRIRAIENREVEWTKEDITRFFGETECAMTGPSGGHVGWYGLFDVRGATDDETNEFLSDVERLYEDLKEALDESCWFVEDYKRFVELMPELHRLCMKAVQWNLKGYWRCDDHTREKLGRIMHESDPDMIIGIIRQKQYGKLKWEQED